MQCKDINRGRIRQNLPNLLITDPPENAIQFKVGNLSKKAKDNRIPELGKHVVKTVK